MKATWIVYRVCDGKVICAAPTHYAAASIARVSQEDVDFRPILTGAGRTTPLHTAIDAVDPDMVQALLLSGADPDALDGWGCSPMSALFRQFRLLDALGIVFHTDAERKEFEAECLRCLRLMLKHGACVVTAIAYMGDKTPDRIVAKWCQRAQAANEEEALQRVVPHVARQQQKVVRI